MNNIWITSDTHFSHTNIAGPKVSSWNAGYRNYESVEEMNSAIVDSFNSRVAYNDTIYHLGDWSFGGKDKIEKFMYSLVCKNIILIYGNHDYNIRKHYRHLFKETHELLNRKIAGRSFVFCHYALRVWEKSHHGTLHCYGHSHHTLPEIGKSMDVGWCKFRRPLNIDEVIKELDSRSVTYVDHHQASTRE